jgi:SnoaL-like domain
MADDDLRARVEVLEAKSEIALVLFNYARACDRADRAMMRDCFWPESAHKHGKYEGPSSGFLDYAFAIIEGMKFAAHHISNVAIEVRGDRAFSECYYLAHHRRVAEGAGEIDEFYEGRYLDFHERRDGVWKIIRRRGQSDFISQSIPANIPFANWPAGAHSEHGPSDEYYSMRKAFLEER